MDLPVKWHIAKQKFGRRYFFREKALGMFLIELSEIVRQRF